MKAPHLLLALLVVTLLDGTAHAQTTAFTFQGRLNETGVPASGSYDLQLKLYDTAAVGTGTQVGATITLSAVQVTNGMFTVQPDFTANAFPGADRFVEVGVKPAGSAAGFNILSPREPITSTPYAIRSVSAITADSATNATSAGHASNADNASQATNANTATTATNADNATQLGGQPASNYVQTTDARLSDARAPTAGSASYIQNTGFQQVGRFNITGNGIFGGNVGIGTAIPSSKLEIAAQDGLKIHGYQPFLTLSDSNGGDKSAFLQSANGDAFLLTNSKAALTLKDGTGNVGIGTATPDTKLTLSGGPAWTSNGWTASLNLQNGSAFGWEANTAGNHFGIGQSNGGLYFFRSASAFGGTTTPASYDITITDTGNVTQPTYNNGFVKASALINCLRSGCSVGTCSSVSYSVIDCYNSATNSTNGGCGFFLSNATQNSVNVNFGFQIDHRFISLTPGVGESSAAVYAFPNTTTLTVVTALHANNGSSQFYILVY